MLKTAALALAVLVTASIGADSAMAGGQIKVRHPPIKLGNVDRGGAKVKVFRLTKLDKKQKAPKTSGPDRLPRK